MKKSKELLENPLKKGEALHDQIFCLGEVTQEKNNWYININSETPIVTTNKSKDLPSVQEIRRKHKLPELSLISGGSIIWITNLNTSEKTMLCLQREMNASTDPGSFTGPAGRSGEKLSITIENETNEEINIFANNKLLRYSDFTKLDSTEEVITFVNGEIFDTVKSCFVYFDKLNNTLEVREILEYTVANISEITSVKDGEDYNRRVGLMTIEELNNVQMVPALVAYVKTLKNLNIAV